MKLHNYSFRKLTDNNQAQLGWLFGLRNLTPQNYI